MPFASRASFAPMALLALCLSPAAQAGTPDHVVVGASVVHAPSYQGAENYRTLPIPVIDLVQGPFFANLQNGVGINVIDSSALTLGGSIAVMPGYRRKDVPDGIGRLSFGVGGRLFARAKVGGLVAMLGGTRGLAGNTRGFIGDASLSYPVVAGPRLLFIPSVSTTWGNKKHNNRYFGIDDEQARASGLSAYHAGSGFKDASAALTASYRLTDRINVNATGGVTRLLGDAQDSPIVFHKLQPLGMLSVSFRLGA